jgi:hypothetical protein
MLPSQAPEQQVSLVVLSQALPYGVQQVAKNRFGSIVGTEGQVSPEQQSDGLSQWVNSE